jgi:hypothetical protein
MTSDIVCYGEIKSRGIGKEMPQEALYFTWGGQVT